MNPIHPPIGQSNSLPVPNNPSWAHIAFGVFLHLLIIKPLIIGGMIKFRRNNLSCAMRGDSGVNIGLIA
jgi:hypothetical protein